MTKKPEGPPIINEEVELAIKKTKKHKSPGPDEIKVEEIKSLGEFGTQKLTEIIAEIYETGEIPDNLTKSVFIALPKKSNATKCEQHRTISLMSHVTKIMLRVILSRVRNKTKPEITQTQCGFVSDSGTRNAIFLLRMLAERTIEMKQDLYICFIDYTKAFDTVQHDKLLELIADLDVDGKDERIIRGIYLKQTAAVKINNVIGTFVEIKRGVRQGCVMSPDFWNLYDEIIFRMMEHLPGINIGGQNINNIRYADDAALTGSTQDILQALLDKLAAESTTMGLSINPKKTECMVISKSHVIPVCNIFLDNIQIKQVNRFVYLGSLITSDGKCDEEIKRRIGMAKDAFNKMDKILKSHSISIKTRLRVLHCYVIPVLTYASETWTISSEMEKRLKAAEMWFLRRMLRIKWTSHTSNAEVPRRAGCQQNLILTIRRHQLEFFGHAMRKEGLEDLFVTGKVEGRRDRGRQRMTYLSSLAGWTGVPELELIRAAKDRTRWKIMVANVCSRHGT